jgi:hypothetical protein
MTQLLPCKTSAREFPLYSARKRKPLLESSLKRAPTVMRIKGEVGSKASLPSCAAKTDIDGPFVDLMGIAPTGTPSVICHGHQESRRRDEMHYTISRATTGYSAQPESVPKWLLPDEQFEKAVHLTTYLSMDHLDFPDSCDAFIAARVKEANHFACEVTQFLTNMGYST